MLMCACIHCFSTEEVDIINSKTSAGFKVLFNPPRICAQKPTISTVFLNYSLGHETHPFLHIKELIISLKPGIGKHRRCPLSVKLGIGTS